MCGTLECLFYCKALARALVWKQDYTSLHLNGRWSIWPFSVLIFKTQYYKDKKVQLAENRSLFKFSLPKNLSKKSVLNDYNQTVRANQLNFLFILGQNMDFARKLSLYKSPERQKDSINFAIQKFILGKRASEKYRRYKEKLLSHKSEFLI